MKQRYAIAVVALITSACGGTPFFDRNGLGSTPIDAAAVDAPPPDAPDAFRALVVAEAAAVEADVAVDAVEAAPDAANVEATTPDAAVEAAIPPDACAAPTTHSNGLGATWQDCTPLNTFNEAQAFAACLTSFTSCALIGYVCGHGGPNTGNVCACWQIAGANAGLVFQGTWGAGGCAGGAPETMWN